ncbi:MAG: LPS export ABC transporter periplasmic protein LptC [Rhizobiaceae bacterium]|nr:LPS export ABC transporter periplasmic protein LptC [Rhizobiaceae bacterium]
MNQIRPHIATEPVDPVDLPAIRDISGYQIAESEQQVAHRHNLEFIGREREVGDFENAAKHSRRVVVLKRLLPLAGIIIIALILAALFMRPKLPANITIGSAGIENGKLVMQNPKLNGFDPQNRPYSVEAVRALQSVEDPTQVELDQIKAKLPMEDGVWADIIAGNGSFDVTEKKLELGGGINIVTTDGMTMNLSDAYIDIKAGSMVTDRAIKFSSDNATISSQSLEIFENGDRIIFDTNVRLIIQPPAKKPDTR